MALLLKKKEMRLLLRKTLSKIRSKKQPFFKYVRFLCEYSKPSSSQRGNRRLRYDFSTHYRGLKIHQTLRSAVLRHGSDSDDDFFRPFKRTTSKIIPFVWCIFRAFISTETPSLSVHGVRRRSLPRKDPNSIGRQPVWTREKGAKRAKKEHLPLLHTGVDERDQGVEKRFGEYGKT